MNYLITKWNELEHWFTDLRRFNQFKTHHLKTALTSFKNSFPEQQWKIYYTKRLNSKDIAISKRAFYDLLIEQNLIYWEDYKLVYNFPTNNEDIVEYYVPNLFL